MTNRPRRDALANQILSNARRQRMTNTPRTTLKMCVPAVISMALAVSLCGCATGIVVQSTTPGSPVAAQPGLRGAAHGGQQPVVGAAIQLLEASTTGYGTYSHQLLPSINPITTDANGAFDITGMYTCDPGALVYIVATGGNPGAGTNSKIALMAALGPCSSLSANTFIIINEVTTVASVYALAGFMNPGPGFVGQDYNSIGTTANNVAGLTQAFADVNQLVDVTTGTAPGPALPPGASFSVAELNTLADIVAVCVNSTGGTAPGDDSCYDLFYYAESVTGYQATDTIMALWNIVQNRANYPSYLFDLADPSGPFQPTLSTAPNDWTLAITYSGGGIAKPSSLAIDASGNVWIGNGTGNSVTELTHAGVPVAGSPFTGAVSGPSAIALDQNGIPWVASPGNGSLLYLNPAGGSGLVASGGGLNLPTAIAIDAQGNIWAANGGANTVSEFNSAGVAVSGSGYNATGILKPLGIAISPQ